MQFLNFLCFMTGNENNCVWMKSSPLYESFETSLKFLIIRNWIKKQPYLCYSIGIKKYGNNWRMLEMKLPSRSGPQIRSHAQKFMARIKNEYGTEDPLKFILEHPWDDLKLYKFEHFRENANQVYSKGDSSNNNADDSSFKLSESKWF